MSRNTPFAAAGLAACLLLAVPAALALEDCYLQIDFKESRIGDGTALELLNITPIYGDYRGLLNPYSQGSSYSIEAYGNNSEPLGQYSFYSSLAIHYDGVDLNGEPFSGVILQNETITSAIVPYSEEIESLKVHFGQNETTIPISALGLDCAIRCKNQNESGKYGLDRCCSGLMPATQGADSFVCVNCGDGICSQNEDYRSCFEDCPKAAAQPPQPESLNQPYGAESTSLQPEGQSPLLFIALAIILLAIIGAALFLRKRRRAKTFNPDAK